MINLCYVDKYLIIAFWQEFPIGSRNDIENSIQPFSIGRIFKNITPWIFKGPFYAS